MSNTNLIKKLLERKNPVKFSNKVFYLKTLAKLNLDENYNLRYLLLKYNIMKLHP